LLGLIGVAAAAAGGALAWFAEEFRFAPGTFLSLGILAATAST